jgi:hypothetical protein
MSFESQLWRQSKVYNLLFVLLTIWIKSTKLKRAHLSIMSFLMLLFVFLSVKVKCVCVGGGGRGEGVMENFGR